MRRWLTNYKQGLVGGLLAVLLTSALPAVAAEVGDALQLGKGNTIDARTTLVGNDPTQSLRIFNTDPEGEALRLNVQPGNPPMVVNSSRRVPKLNADRLDSYQANQLIRAAYASTDDAPDGYGGTFVTATISAPRPGILIMGGGVSHGSAGTYWCNLSVDGSFVTGTNRNSGPGAYNCNTDGAIVVDAGTHTVTLYLDTFSPPVVAYWASVWVIWVPFDGNGQVPTPG